MSNNVNEISFEERAIGNICESVNHYKKVFVDKEYILYSKNFLNQPFYRITGTSKNFLHLTGVKTRMNASQFYSKAKSGNLKSTDIFIKKKGSVRRKCQALLVLETFFDDVPIYVEESFKKNNICCDIATSNNSKATIGFIESGNKLVPNTLLKETAFQKNKRIPVALILSMPKGTSKFNFIEYGDINLIASEPNIIELLSDELKELIDCD